MSQPLVSIIMGSDSDLQVMSAAASVLTELGIPHQVSIASAHRTPAATREIARGADSQGIRVIIAGAGGAAHLPGVIAAYTNLPVIGVPIATKALGGIDSLYSIVQMPSGIPVAAMAVNGAKNAGIFAAQILALENPTIKQNLEAYKEGLAANVIEKNNRLQQLGVEGYLSDLNREK